VYNRHGSHPGWGHINSLPLDSVDRRTRNGDRLPVWEGVMMVMILGGGENDNRLTYWRGRSASFGAGLALRYNPLR